MLYAALHPSRESQAEGKWMYCSFSKEVQETCFRRLLSAPEKTSASPQDGNNGKNKTRNRKPAVSHMHHFISNTYAVYIWGNAAVIGHFSLHFMGHFFFETVLDIERMHFTVGWVKKDQRYWAVGLTSFLPHSSHPWSRFHFFGFSDLLHCTPLLRLGPSEESETIKSKSCWLQELLGRVLLNKRTR